MPTDSPPFSESPPHQDATFSSDSPTIKHSGISELITMNRYHLTLVLERLKKGSKLPKYADAWPWMGTFLALFSVLITTEPKSFLGINGNAWEALYILAGIFSGAIFICRLVQAFNCRKERAKTPEQEVEEIIKQMASDRERAAGA